MKRILLAVAAAVALLVGPMMTNSADAQYRYRSYRPYYGGGYYNNYYRPYYGGGYYNSYYRPYYSGYRGYYGGYRGGYRGYYSQPGVYIGGRGFGVGIGF